MDDPRSQVGGNNQAVRGAADQDRLVNSGLPNLSLHLPSYGTHDQRAVQNGLLRLGGVVGAEQAGQGVRL